MRYVMPASIMLGILWNVLAVGLMGGRWADSFSIGWLLAGALAGIAAGMFAIGSRRRRDGRENLLDGIANYYVGIIAYWASFVVVERIILCARHGGWTDFDLRDHLMLIASLLIRGTALYGVVLIPMCFLSRHVLWKLYTYAETRAPNVSPSP